MAKVIEVNDGLRFDDGSYLYSDHDQDCCENHYLDFSDISVDDFKHLDFDLSSELFFERVDGFGIRIIAVNGVAIPVPGYASNNGYYSSNLTLHLDNKIPEFNKSWDISECQEY